jgi:predicted transcriptional regulator of viral defense system
VKKTVLPASRERLAVVLRATADVISIDVAARALELERTPAAKLLSRWASQGWMRRVGPGLYIPVPIDLATSEQVVSDPWILVPSLFGEAYIGGWTAAHYWDLTEQLFNETLIFSTQRIYEPYVVAQGAKFLAFHIARERLFGIKAVWRGATRVTLSDPARTVVDMLALPQSGGGIDHVADCLFEYRKRPDFNLELLIDYAQKFGNGAVFKRLGFLAEAHLHDEYLAAACRANLTRGYAKLDSTLDCNQLVTTWHLWVPERWKVKLT